MNLVISFTPSGEIIGKKVGEYLVVRHIVKSQYKGDIRELIRDSWKNVDSIIFISSTGIAIRYIKDFIVSKDVDPGIIVIDDMGKNIISLLSGHLGGANELSAYLGEKLNANPIITTATDNRGIESVDLYSKKNNLIIENIKDIKPISMLMLEDKEIGFYSDVNVSLINYQNIKKINSLDKGLKLDGAIIVTNKLVNKFNIPNIILRPKNIVLGIGCRKGITKEQIIEGIKTELENLNLSQLSLYKFGTVEAKKEEIGIFEAAKHFGCEVEIFSNEEISKVEDKFQKSQFVKDTIGVYSVSEPACHLLGGRILSGKQKYNGITLSVGEIDL